MADSTAGWGLNTTAAQMSFAQSRITRASNSERPDKMEQAAREFESILLTQWLEQAHSAFAGVPGGDEDDTEAEAGEGQLRSLGMQALATGVSKAGGLGIARMILHQLQQQSQPTTSESASAGSRRPGTATNVPARIFPKLRE